MGALIKGLFVVDMRFSQNCEKIRILYFTLWTATAILRLNWLCSRASYILDNGLVNQCHLLTIFWPSFGCCLGAPSRSLASPLSP